jgi:hypothetical protein
MDMMSNKGAELSTLHVNFLKNRQCASLSRVRRLDSSFLAFNRFTAYTEVIQVDEKPAFSADRVRAGSRQNHMAQATPRPSDFHKGGG